MEPAPISAFGASRATPDASERAPIIQVALPMHPSKIQQRLARSWTSASGQPDEKTLRLSMLDLMANKMLKHSMGCVPLLSMGGILTHPCTLVMNHVGRGQRPPTHYHYTASRLFRSLEVQRHGARTPRPVDWAGIHIEAHVRTILSAIIDSEATAISGL